MFCTHLRRFIAKEGVYFSDYWNLPTPENRYFSNMATNNMRNVFSSVSDKVFPGSGNILAGKKADFLETGKSFCYFIG